jgi:hypothetical protein
MLEIYTKISEKIDGNITKSPGMKYRHYAPEIDIIIIDKDEYTNINTLIMSKMPVAYLGI